MLTCEGCGAALPPNKARGRRRKWCSDRCRKIALYSRRCVDCGAIINTDGRVAGAAERCGLCANRANGAARKVWTREAIITAIREWAREYGEPPAGPDWTVTKARAMGDEARARRFEGAEGRWPGHMTLVREFGSWNAAIRAAGFEPRPRGGGGGNELRRRTGSYGRVAR